MVDPQPRQGALAAAENLVRHRRALADADPAYLPDLARSLNNVAIRYTSLGRRADVLPVAQEALEIYGDLAAENPGRADVAGDADHARPAVRPLVDVLRAAQQERSS